MKKAKLDNFIQIAKAAIYEAGDMALKHQGHIDNVGKTAEEMEIR